MTSNKVLPGEQPNEMNNNACDHSPCQPQVVTLPPPDGGPGTKATRKARNRRGRSDAIEHKLYCFPDCKRGRAQSESMVQCHACQTWAHYECIGEGEDDIVGIWTCNAHRRTGEHPFGGGANIHLGGQTEFCPNGEHNLFVTRPRRVFFSPGYA